MAVDIFNPLKDLQGNKLKTANWYRNAVSLITDKSSPAQLMKDGKLLGDKLKQLETAWLSNNFKLADEKVDSILRN